MLKLIEFKEGEANFCLTGSFPHMAAFCYSKDAHFIYFNLSSIYKYIETWELDLTEYFCHVINHEYMHKAIYEAYGKHPEIVTELISHQQNKQWHKHNP